MKIWVFVLILTTVLAFWAGCEKGPTSLGPLPSDEPTASDPELITFKLQGNYTNPTGNLPQFELDSSLTAAAVKFVDLQKSISVHCRSSLAVSQLLFTKLSVVNNGRNYLIRSVVVEEDRDRKNKWHQDGESCIDFRKLTEAAVVLVLDVSESLGKDFNNVIQYASQFIKTIADNIPHTQIGVVIFSTDITQLSLTNDVEKAQNFIKSATQGQFTALYQAMLNGVTLLDGVSQEGRFLVTFTDGVDNHSTVSSDSVLAALEKTAVKSYTVGMGNIDAFILGELGKTGGSTIVKQAADLEVVFAQISKAIANVYDLEYKRSSIKVTNPIPIRLLLQTELNVGQQ